MLFMKKTGNYLYPKIFYRNFNMPFLVAVTILEAYRHTLHRSFLLVIFPRMNWRGNYLYLKTFLYKNIIYISYCCRIPIAEEAMTAADNQTRSNVICYVGK